MHGFVINLSDLSVTDLPQWILDLHRYKIHDDNTNNDHDYVYDEDENKFDIDHENDNKDEKENEEKKNSIEPQRQSKGRLSRPPAFGNKKIDYKSFLIDDSIGVDFEVLNHLRNRSANSSRNSSRTGSRREYTSTGGEDGESLGESQL